jgi:4-hydroxybutyrate CoA-transferase
MHNPAAIARNDNMVAVNNALMVDLAGQIAAGQFGTTVWSGTGGQLAYQLGASISRGGRAVTVLPSTAQDGAVSRIVARMPLGQIITVPRDLADIVITEHGIAHLLNKTQRERARALIDIAHPKFRDELLDEAKQLYGS